MKAGKKLVLLLALLMAFSLVAGTAAWSANDAQVNSAERPDGVELEAVQPLVHKASPVNNANIDPFINPAVPDQSGVVNEPWYYNLKIHENGGSDVKRILLVQDVDSWGTGYQNQAILNDLGLGYDLITSSLLSGTDLYQYTHLLVPSDQPQSYYDNLDANMARITEWVEAGGSFQFNACDEGWQYGHWTYGPGGITHEWGVYENQNYIQDPHHPILQGMTDADFSNWNYVSHGYFTNLPEGTKVLLSEDPDGSRPTLVEFKLGKGHVVASQNTLEWANAGMNNANQLILDKIVLYMFGQGFDTLQWSASDVDETLMEVNIDPVTDVMTINPLAVGQDSILLTLTDTETNKTAMQWVEITIQEEDTTPPQLIVDFPNHCVNEHYYVLYGQVERGAENVTVNDNSVYYYNYDHFWAYWSTEVYLQPGENYVYVTATDESGNVAEVEGYICYGEEGAKLFVNAPEDCVPVGQTFVATLDIKDVNNLYGGDFYVYFDSYYMEAVSVEVNTDEVFSVLGTSEIDNTYGHLSFSASRIYDDYGYEGFDGDATLAWITFRAKNPTHQDCAWISMEAQLVGNGGEEGSPVEYIPVIYYEGDCVEICEVKALRGTVIPEAMPWQQYPYDYDYSGTIVVIEGTGLQTTTDIFGDYMFIDLQEGDYKVVAMRGGYLARAKDISIGNYGGDAGSILLLTGDITNDNVVDIDDLNVMRDDYGVYWEYDIERSDLNYSGWVDIFDLVYLARNYTKYGYDFNLEV